MPRGDARPERLRAVALDLFAAHGVSATSLQMIADALGVTKAAVYHHHRSKDSIVLAVMEPAFASVAALVAAVRALPANERRDAAIAGLSAQAVENRSLYRIMLSDAQVMTMIVQDDALVEVYTELRDQLAGEDASPASRLRVSMFLTSLVAPASDRTLGDLSDEQLRAGIIDAGRRLLG